MSVPKMRIASPNRVTIVMTASRMSGEAGRRRGRRAAPAAVGRVAAIARLASLGAGRGVGRDRRPAPGRRARPANQAAVRAMPVGQRDRRAIAEALGGLVDPADVAPDVAGAGRRVADLERLGRRPRSIAVGQLVDGRLDARSRPGTARRRRRPPARRGRRRRPPARSSTKTKSRVCSPSPWIVDRLAGEGRPQPGGDDALLVERARAVGVREAQRAGGQPVGRRVGLAVGLAGQLGRAVRRDRVGQVGLVGRRLVVAGGRVRATRRRTGGPRPGGPPRAASSGQVDVGLERPERVARPNRGSRPARRGGRRRRRRRPRRRTAAAVGERRRRRSSWGDAVEVGRLADRQVVEDPDAVAAARPAGGRGWSR